MRTLVYPQEFGCAVPKMRRKWNQRALPTRDMGQEIRTGHLCKTATSHIDIESSQRCLHPVMIGGEIRLDKSGPSPVPFQEIGDQEPVLAGEYAVKHLAGGERVMKFAF